MLKPVKPKCGFKTLLGFRTSLVSVSEKQTETGFNVWFRFQCVVSVSMCGFGFNVWFRFRFQCAVSVSMCGVGYVLGGNG